MKIYLTVFVGFLLAAPLFAHTPALLFDPDLAAKADPLFNRGTYDKLNKLTVTVRWDGIDIRSALADLTKKSAESDPDHVAVQFSFQSSGGDPEVAKNVPKTVQLELGDVSLFDVVEYLSQQTHLVPLIHKGSVTMVPGCETRYSFHISQ